jgi:3-deoxy-D-manno-octulosonate 8-phosphate phosphatase (KDO 8-P phosphatase)
VSELTRFHPALRRARALVLDVDGVLTDGRLYYAAKGESLKVFHVRDGYGIKAVAKAGITIAIISGRKSAHVAKRARDLGIKHVFQGVADKIRVLEKLAAKLGLPLEQFVAVGDDTPDAPVLAAVGLGIAVADAHADARAAAQLVTRNAGGHGAVREVCDWLIAARGGRA